jgi:hypothetical protein
VRAGALVVVGDEGNRGDGARDDGDGADADTATVPVDSPTTAPLDWPPAAVAGCSVFAGAFGASDLFASCDWAHAMLATARKTTAQIVFDLFIGFSPSCPVQHSAMI